MKQANQKTVGSRERYFAGYKNNKVFNLNKTKKLQKLQKEQPSNEQIKVALNSVSFTRKAPRVRVWASKQEIATAMLFKLFTGKFSRNVFSTNEDIKAAALKDRNDQLFLNPKKFTSLYPSMYALGNRMRRV